MCLYDELAMCMFWALLWPGIVTSWGSLLRTDPNMEIDTLLVLGQLIYSNLLTFQFLLQQVSFTTTTTVSLLEKWGHDLWNPILHPTQPSPLVMDFDNQLYFFICKIVFLLLSFFKLVKLVSGGSAIKGAYPSSFTWRTVFFA